MRRFPIVIASSLLLAGCEGIQSVVDPKGPQAARIATLWWVMLAICTVVMVAVIALVIMGALKGTRSQAAGKPPEQTRLTHRQQTHLVLLGGVIVPVVVLVGLLIYSVAISNAMTSEPEDPVVVDVIAHQWWWEVRYPNQEQPNLTAVTSNEIHIPAGRPVRVQLASRDVIHSFWVPNLHGKTDMIPGRPTATWLQADEPGQWRGQCGEFCGLQHAHMAFIVVAEPPDDFERWRLLQSEAAFEPADDLSRRGQEVFLGSSCALCHSVRGTLALSMAAPDLTHISSRRTIAAGTLTNNRGNMAGWILDPQAIKPGVRMPPTHLASEDLHALLAYLESLK